MQANALPSALGRLDCSFGIQPHCEEYSPTGDPERHPPRSMMPIPLRRFSGHPPAQPITGITVGADNHKAARVEFVDSLFSEPAQVLRLVDLEHHR
jgi:hypothetical protein